jgi:hypothetical protein
MLLIVTVQVLAVPEHAPDHDVKLYPVAGVAVRVREVPDATDVEHVVPQLIPVPVIVPLDGEVIVRVLVAAVDTTGVTTNVAPTLLALLIVTTQVVVVAEHAPDQPVKVLPVTATAVSVTTVPEAIEEVQDDVQVVIPVPVMYPRPEVVVRERVLFVGVTTGRVAIVLPNDVAETLPALLLAVTVTVSVVPASCVEVA